MNNKLIGIILAVIGIFFIIIGVIKMVPKKQTEVDIINAQLNDEQLQFLIKEMQKYLLPSEDINSNTKFTLDEMLKFTFSYVAYLDSEGTKTQIDEIKNIGIADFWEIKTNITHLFGVEIVDLNDSGYEIKDGKIYIPLNLQGGDAQIYKYKNTTYNKTTKEYIAEIACLEITSPDDVSTLLETSEYNEEDVIYTLNIKYKVVGDRKVLLAYSEESNIEY